MQDPHASTQLLGIKAHTKISYDDKEEGIGPEESESMFEIGMINGNRGIIVIDHTYDFSVILAQNIAIYDK